MRAARETERLVDVGGERLADRAQHAAVIDGARHRLLTAAGLQLPPDQRPALQPLFAQRTGGGGQALAIAPHRQVAAERVASALAVHVTGQGDLRVRAGVGLRRRHRIADHQLRGHAVVEQGVHEGGVGPVLQQPTHQVGQQVLVAPHGRIGPQHHVVAEAGVGRAVERLAHAVQPLVLHPHAGLRRHVAHGRQRMGVVGGELRIERRRGVDERLGRHQIGQVGGRLGGVDRIARPPGHLGALDLGVPVGALHQAHHDAAATGAGEVRHAPDHLHRALLVGLDHQAQPGPVSELVLVRQPLQQFQRQHQPVRLLRVQGEVQVVARGQHRQPLHPRVEFRPDAGLLRRLVAGRQGRQLHRHAMAVLGPCAMAGLADRADRVGVEALVALGVGGRARALAQHVEGAEHVVAPRALERLFDGAAEHELLAHDPHRRHDGLAHHRLAEASREALDEAADVAPRLLVHLHQLAGQHQPPGGGVDEQAVGAAEMAGPIGRADLLGDQAVAGVLVGRAQQRLGQAHERQAFLGAERELLQEAFHHPLAPVRAARSANEGLRLRLHERARRVIQGTGGEEGGDRLALVAVLAGVEVVPVPRRRHGVHSARGLQERADLRSRRSAGECASLRTPCHRR